MSHTSRAFRSAASNINIACELGNLAYEEEMAARMRVRARDMKHRLNLIDPDAFISSDSGDGDEFCPSGQSDRTIIGGGNPPIGLRDAVIWAVVIVVLVALFGPMFW